MRTAHLSIGTKATPRRTGTGLVVALGSAWLAFGAVPARANILVNGGFDSDNAAAGPVSPPSGWTATGDAGADSTKPFSGPNDAFLGIGSLSQSIATGAGSTYSLSFELAPDPTVLQDAAATMTISFGGQTVATIKGSQLPSTAYSLYSYQVTAASNNSAVLFSAFTTGDAGDWFVDSVVVNANASAVPEPASGGLLAASLLLLIAAGPVMRRSGRS